MKEMVQTRWCCVKAITSLVTSHAGLVSEKGGTLRPCYDWTTGMNTCFQYAGPLVKSEQTVGGLYIMDNENFGNSYRTDFVQLM